MTAAIGTTQSRDVLGTEHHDRLVLEGNQPRTVYVRAHVENNKNHAEFASDPNGHWHKHGIHWKCPDEDPSLVMTFQFTGVNGVDCVAPVLYSPPFGTDPLQQFCAVPPATQRTTHHLWVIFPDHTRIDPQIIVTPIGGGTDDT